MPEAQLVAFEVPVRFDLLELFDEPLEEVGSLDWTRVEGLLWVIGAWWRQSRSGNTDRILGVSSQVTRGGLESYRHEDRSGL